MDVRDESVAEAVREPLPDLLDLDLGQLMDFQHPVLNEVLTELRERAVRPSETLWGFNNAM